MRRHVAKPRNGWLVDASLIRAPASATTTSWGRRGTAPSYLNRVFRKSSGWERGVLAIRQRSNEPLLQEALVVARSVCTALKRTENVFESLDEPWRYRSRSRPCDRRCLHPDADQSSAQTSRFGSSRCRLRLAFQAPVHGLAHRTGGAFCGICRTGSPLAGQVSRSRPETGLHMSTPRGRASPSGYRASRRTAPCSPQGDRRPIA
jgi:hypothetical protein